MNKQYCELDNTHLRQTWRAHNKKILCYPPSLSPSLKLQWMKKATVDKLNRSGLYRLMNQAQRITNTLKKK